MEIWVWRMDLEDGFGDLVMEATEMERCITSTDVFGGVEERIRTILFKGYWRELVIE